MSNNLPSPDQLVALVTGASSGIGRDTARQLEAAGYVVVGTSRDAAKASPLQGIELISLDVTSDESVAAAVAEVVERFGRIDVLVNNAGVGMLGGSEEHSIAQARFVFEVNVFGVMRMMNAVLPYMRAQGGGRIINVSSVLGLIPAPYMAAYAATKHAIEGYSESVDHEVREHGIRVLVVEPGYTGTAFESSSIAPDSPVGAYATQREVAQDVLATAMRKADDPAVVARAIVATAGARRPRQRSTAGSLAGRVSILRRYVPSAAFDKQIRKLNRLPS